MLRFGWLWMVVWASLGLGFARADATDKNGANGKQARSTPRCFELRVYTAHPGKLESLHKRFREHTNRLFLKHGMQIVGYWTPAEGPEKENTLVYLLAYPSRDQRDEAWEAFRNDAEWKRVYDESHKDGPLVLKVDSQFLNPTDYSPLR